MASSQSPQAVAEQRASEQFALGNQYAEGRGVVRDDAEAARRFREAAELGPRRGAVRAREPVCRGAGRGPGRRLQEVAGGRPGAGDFTRRRADEVTAS